MAEVRYTLVKGRLKELAAKYGRSLSALSREMGQNNAYASQASAGSQKLTMVQVEFIAKWVGTTSAYLLGETDDPSPADAPADPLDGLRFALFGEPAKDVTEAQLDDVKRYAAYIRERDKEKK